MPSTLPNRSSWCCRAAITPSTSIRNRFWRARSSSSSPSRSAVASSPTSIRRARSTSWAAVRSGTFPISLRYMRTGSFVGALSRSTSIWRCALASTSSPGTSMTSMPSPRRCSSTCVRNSSTCSGVNSSTGTASRRSSDVTNPRSRPRAVICSFASSSPRSRATSVTRSLRVAGRTGAVYEAETPVPTSTTARVASRTALLAQPPELSVRLDQLLEQRVVAIVRLRVHLLQLLPQRRAPSLQREFLQPRPDVFRVLERRIAVERLERERGQRLDDAIVLRSRDRRGDVAARLHEQREQLSVADELEVLGCELRRDRGVDLAVAREQSEHLAFDALLGRSTLHRLAQLDRAPRHPVLQRHQHGRLGDADEVREHVRVLGPPNRVGESLEHRKARGHRGGLALDRAQLVPGDRPPEHVLDQRDGAGRELAEGVSPARLDEVRGVLTRGQDQDHRLDREALEERERALGGAGAGLVAVEQQDHPLREPGREPEVPLAEGGAARRDRGL